MNKIELLAPAGNLEKLKFAYLYGADACYIGGRDFSLRANAKNFSIEEINEACSYAHNLGKKVYVTVNIVFHNEDINGITEYLKELARARVDAIIVSDPLVIDVVKENNIDFAVDVYPHYGSDADVALTAGYDVRHGLIGAGVYASHGYERSHVDGVKNTFELLKAYLG